MDTLIGTWEGWSFFKRILFTHRGDKEVISFYAIKGTRRISASTLDEVKIAVAQEEGREPDPSLVVDPGEHDLKEKIENPQTYDVVPYINGKYDFQLNKWVGPITTRMLGTTGNMVSLGPVSADYSQYFALALLVLVNKLTKTPEGLKVLEGLITKYLDNIGEIIKGIHFSSSSNVYTALINAYTAQPIYERLGLISPKDATQNRIYCDHYYDEMLKAGYFKDTLTGLSTLVNATGEKVTKEGTSYTGLASIAKLFGGG